MDKWKNLLNLFINVLYVKYYILLKIIYIIFYIFLDIYIVIFVNVICL